MKQLVLQLELRLCYDFVNNSFYDVTNTKVITLLPTCGWAMEHQSYRDSRGCPARWCQSCLWRSERYSGRTATPPDTARSRSSQRSSHPSDLRWQPRLQASHISSDQILYSRNMRMDEWENFFYCVSLQYKPIWYMIVKRRPTENKWINIKIHSIDFPPTGRKQTELTPHFISTFLAVVAVPSSPLPGGVWRGAGLSAGRSK